MDVLKKESWKNINGYEGLYSISDLGNVKSLKRIVTHKRGTLSVNEKIIIPYISTFGYPSVKISSNNKSKNFKIHRLIAIAFIPNPDNLPQVNHINGIKTDNRIENLEWTTHSGNMIHALDTKLRVMPNGIETYNSKLTDRIIIKARERYASEKISYGELAKEYSVSKTVIMRAMKGQTWKHLKNSN